MELTFLQDGNKWVTEFEANAILICTSRKALAR